MTKISCSKIIVVVFDFTICGLFQMVTCVKFDTQHQCGSEGSMFMNKQLSTVHSMESGYGQCNTFTTELTTGYNQGTQCGKLCNFDPTCSFFYSDPATTELCTLCLERPSSDEIILDQEVLKPSNMVVTNSSKVFVKCGPVEFGGTEDSHWLYDSSSNWPGIVSHYNITLQFKTTFPDGIFFFATGDSHKPGEFLSGFLESGQLVQKINAGFGSHKLTTSITGMYNDNKWHWVSFVKDTGKKELIIVVDGQEIKKNIADNRMNTEVSKAYHIGGIPNNLISKVQGMLGTSKGFTGYLTDMTLNGSPFGKPAQRHYTRPPPIC